MSLLRWDELPESLRVPQVRPYYESLSRKRAALVCKRVFDVAAVDIPAYDGTSIAARSWAKAEAEREHAEADKRRRLELKLKTYGITKEEK